MLLRADRSALAAWIRPALASVALAAVWLLLAWRSPTSTHHFAPLVVAAAWGFFTELSGPAPARRAAAAGVSVAVFVLVALGLNDRLLGPTLWHSRPSWPELLGFAVLGGLVTLVRGRLAGKSPSRV